MNGFRSGLSGFGLCLLSAIAGVAHQPLQAVFQHMEQLDCDAASSAHTHITDEPGGYIVWSALGGFGRGLVGVVVKPVAGAAELVAQTGRGLLRSTEWTAPTTTTTTNNNASHTNISNNYAKITRMNG